MRRWCVGALVVVAVLSSSCGRTRPADDGKASAEAGLPGSTGPDELVFTGGVGVRAIEVDADGRRLVLETVPVPGPDGPTGCRALVTHATASESAELVEVWAMASTDGGRSWSGCPNLDSHRVGATLNEPLAGRPIRTTTPLAVWTMGADGRYSVCERPACDPGPADPEPTVTCDDGSLADAARQADVPAHSAINSTRCQGRFAVVDVDLGAGACPAGGDSGEANPCAGQRVQRMYLRASGDHWQVAYESNEAGCADVRTHLPSFPVPLCADLPAIALPGRG